jgi:hypothetical protein
MLRKPSLVNEVAAAQNDICLLLVGRKYIEAYWMVLPDKRMVLWRFEDRYALLKWKAKDFAFWKCEDSRSDCVGAIISPYGKLALK